MTTLQRIRLRLSEVRSRLNEISGLEGEAFTAEIRAEADALQLEFSDLETRHRAAIIAEGEPTDPASENTGEGAELRQLTGRAKLSRYLASAATGSPVDGAEAELREAYGIEDASGVPWAAIAPRQLSDVETRADAVTPAPSTLPRSQDAILARVFPSTGAAFLGVGMPRVPVGEASFPVLTSGQTAKTLAKGGTVESVAGTFSVLNLSPKRITARFSFAVEDAAVLRGMESALREDLSASLASAIDKAILTGDGTAPNVSGFFDSSSGSLTVPSNPSAVASYENYLASIGDQIDGQYANGAGAVRVLIGAQTAGHMVRTLQSGSGMTAWESVSRLAGGLRVSGSVPAMDGTSKVQHAIAKRGTARAAVAPIWEGVRLIRDEITGAASGQVHVTALGLYSFGFVRAAQYRMTAYKLVA